MGHFFDIKKDTDKQSMGSGSTMDKVLTSGTLSRLQKNRVFGGGGGGGVPPKFTISDKPQKKLWGPLFLTFFAFFDIFDKSRGIPGV